MLHSCPPVNATLTWRNFSKRLKHMPTRSGKDGLGNIFRNGTRYRSGQKNMCETWKKVNFFGWYMTPWNTVIASWDESLRSSLATTVFCDQRESKWHMESWTGQSWSYRQYSMTVFPRSKTGLAMLAPLQVSCKNHQTARSNLWNRKNFEFVKTQKWSKMKIFTSCVWKFVHPPIFGTENMRNPRS